MKNTVVQQIKVPKSKEIFAKIILKYVEAALAESSSEHLQSLVQAMQPQVVSEESRALAKEIAGDDYREGSSVLLQLANLERYYQRRRELLADSITTPQVAKLIGCQAVTTVHDRRKANTLLGLKDNGVYKFPLWQFDPEGDDGVIDGLPKVLAALDVSSFRKLNWLTRPHRAMEGKTPIEMLKQGEIEDVVIEARAVGVGQ
jgi:Protein of unknown function (DUF2384)